MTHVLFHLAPTLLLSPKCTCRWRLCVHRFCGHLFLLLHNFNAVALNSFTSPHKRLGTQQCVQAVRPSSASNHAATQAGLLVRAALNVSLLAALKCKGCEQQAVACLHLFAPTVFDPLRLIQTSLVPIQGVFHKIPQCVNFFFYYIILL